MRFAFLFACLLMLLPQIAGADPSTQPVKLWTTDLSAYINQHPQQHWIVGTSKIPALSAEEAQTDAESDAVDKLASVLDSQLSNRLSSRILKNRIAAALKSDDWIVDREIQSTQRPYATLWHCAVLIDAAPQKLTQLSRQLQVEANQKQHRQGRAIGGALVWLTAISLLYLTLNWFTRGYFRARLIFMSLILMVGGVAGMIHLL